MKIALIESRTVTLAGIAGAASGIVRYSPSVAGTRAHIDSLSVQMTTTASPTFSLFLNSVSATGYRDSTSKGAQATDPDTGLDLYDTDTLIGVWAGGNPGDIAMLNIRGTFDTGR